MRYQSEAHLVFVQFHGAVCWWLLLHYAVCILILTEG